MVTIQIIPVLEYPFTDLPVKNFPDSYHYIMNYNHPERFLR